MAVGTTSQPANTVFIICQKWPKMPFWGQFGYLCYLWRELVALEPI